MITTRFAPSPTGRLHLGHAFAARTAFEEAKRAGGRFVLRIEDIDQTRCRSEFVDGIYEDLEWLGLSWDGTPLVQSEHINEYKSVLETLFKKEVLYPCVCTRREIEAEILRIGHAPHSGGTIPYPGTCRGKQVDLNDFQTYSWRLDISKSVQLLNKTLFFTDRVRGNTPVHADIFGDVILARKEMPASYHLCSVYDDWKQGVTLVTRGEDLFDSTHVHRVLQELLGFPAPEYFHHQLIFDAEGKRLAKRNKSVTIKNLRENGLNPKDIWTYFS